MTDIDTDTAATLHLIKAFKTAHGYPFGNTVVFAGKAPFVFGAIRFRDMQMLQQEIYLSCRENRIPPNAYHAHFTENVASFHFRDETSLHEFMSAMGVSQNTRSPAVLQVSHQNAFWHHAAKTYIETSPLEDEVLRVVPAGHRHTIVNYNFANIESMQVVLDYMESGRIDQRANVLKSAHIKDHKI